LQRNPLSAIVVEDGKRVIATADAGAQSSIIFWDAATGEPVAMIESPHAGGTTALALTPDGRYLSTLSVAGPAEEGGSAGPQELAVWDCACVLAAVGAAPVGWVSDAEGGESPTPVLVTSAMVPCRDEQTSLAVSRLAPASAVAIGRTEPGREGGVVGASWEMASTGGTSVVFWAVTRTAVRDTEAGARAGKTGALAASLGDVAGRKYPTKDVWALASAAPAVPLPNGRTLSQTAFLPGHRAEHISSIDSTVAASKAADAAEEALGGGSTLMRASTLGKSTGTLSPGKAPRGAVDPRGTVMLAAPTGALISAATAASDGMLLLWQAADASSTAEAAIERGRKAGPGGGIAAAAAVVVRRTCMKAVKLAGPQFLDITKKGAAEPSATSTTLRINALRTTPGGANIVVGTEEGAVRVYDLNMRLVGWFDDLAAGPVTAFDFVPRTTRAELGGLAQPGMPLKSTLAEVPDLVLATRRCMTLSLSTASFDTPSPADERRRGVVLFEGPDAPVTGLAAYPREAKLAVAVASGVLQVWDTNSKALLVLRELNRPVEPGLLGGKASGGGFYHPTALAADALGRFVAVGTAEGFLLVLSPDTLSDVQAPLPPATYPRPSPAITRVTFSPDGYHLAASDATSHVSLFRFTRTASRRLVEGVGSVTAAQRLASRKPWETVIPEGDRFEEVVVDAWMYIGRVKGHSAGGVTGLAFSELPPGAVRPGAGGVAGLAAASFWAPDTIDDGEVARRHTAAGLSHLASVGADARLCLYDVGGASIDGGLPVRASRTEVKVEAGGAKPSAAVWLPPRASCPALARDYAATPSGSSLVIASDAFKLRVWDCEGTPMPARTALAPTFGGAVTHAAFLRSRRAPSARADADGKGKEEGATYALAYATDDRIVGIARLPLDGSPYGYVGVVGHTGPVLALAASADGLQLFTAGMGGDAGSGSVCIWGVHEDAVAASSAAGGTGVTPFLSLLEGGAGGRQYSDICDLFSYAQIRAQGESSTAPRWAGVDLPISELCAVMRGLGYFPTAEDADALAAEARASMGDAGSADGSVVDLQTLVRLFVNHRPVRPPTGADVLAAMERISSCEEVVADGGGTGGMRWGGLARLLSTHGEELGEAELAQCLAVLLESQGGVVLDEEDVLTGADVSTKLLGLA